MVSIFYQSTLEAQLVAESAEEGFGLDAVARQNEDVELIALLEQTAFEFPGLLEADVLTNEDAMYNHLLQALVKQKRGAEALGWAKLRFMTAPYNPESIRRASRFLMQVWTAVEPDGKSVAAFTAAQKDSTKPNPLSQIKLPPFPLDGNALQKQLARLDLHDQITLHIWAGSLDKAIDEARKLVNRPLESQKREGALEIGRLLKAADLNLQRANTFLIYLKNNEGADPVNAFLNR